MRPQLKNLRRLGTAAALLFAALLFCAMTAGLVDVAFRAVRLGREGVQTTARVVEIGPGGHRAHSVRYHFTVGDDPRTYSATDVFRLRRDTTATVAPAVWEQARRTGTIRVRFLPSDPWINLPAEAPPYDENPWVSGILAALAGVFALIGWAAFVGTVVRRHRPA